MTKNTYQCLVNKLPYSESFLFVDEILNVSEKSVEGTYRFKPEATFYNGHFKDNPVTPGVLLTECCAQIGLVCLGIYLLGEENNIEDLKIGMSSSQMEFLLPVFPGERVRVTSELIYYRFHKLKCNVKMFNEKDKLVCKGTLAGMMVINNE
ncbi:hotdog domain-containing protein [uncultured Maribacter sp.]|uniref:3-hydroxyacyl-ACP dehydratase FabZ family protein n=1 Tax=uncultured Maribacter sp. TaxID=431308 RepID=UPI0030DC0379